MEEIVKEAMDKAIEESNKNINNEFTKGGPFGAAIVKDGEIIATAHNTVIKSKDPTAHAEVNAIRKAAKILDTHDLTGCILFTSAEPCPMCLSAAIWANIKEIYYANTRQDAEDIGFRDDDIYDYLKGDKKNFVKMHHVRNKDAKEAFEEFDEAVNKEIY